MDGTKYDLTSDAWTKVAFNASAALIVPPAGVRFLGQLAPEDEAPDWAEPIRPSREDVLTDGTLGQIVAHNEIGERLCGWRP